VTYSRSRVTWSVRRCTLFNDRFVSAPYFNVLLFSMYVCPSIPSVTLFLVWNVTSWLWLHGEQIKIADCYS
jgi:hypothetical protein